MSSIEELDVSKVKNFVTQSDKVNSTIRRSFKSNGKKKKTHLIYYPQLNSHKSRPPISIKVSPSKLSGSLSLSIRIIYQFGRRIRGIMFAMTFSCLPIFKTRKKKRKKKERRNYSDCYMKRFSR